MTFGCLFVLWSKCNAKSCRHPFWVREIQGGGFSWLPFGWSRTLSLGQPSEVVLMITFWLITFLLHTQKGDYFFWTNIIVLVMRKFLDILIDDCIASFFLESGAFLSVSKQLTLDTNKLVSSYLMIFIFHGNFVSHHICQSFRSFFIYYFQTRICPITSNNKSM